ncbi:MAG: TPM domain-containing protein [Halopseudomonas sabulinigri]|tara:strand:- start:10340 stop:11083 length:744 start_codon:yes stop_codon:yes gene_type:complete
MRLMVSLLCALMLSAGAAIAVAADEQALPTLTGRVVDQAELLGPGAEQQLTQMLAAHEQASSEQVVVVTVPSLQGQSIEQYGVELGRAWGIGQKGEDNGALLIVARDDRKIRIEVGYGLEGRLTDAQSSTIINGIMTPAFREGQFEQGIVQGAAAMIQVLGGNPLAVAERAEKKEKKPAGALILVLIMIGASMLGGGGRGGRGGTGRALLAGALLGGLAGGSRGGGGGGGFGGGGGGFGGGGASGGW